MKYLLDRAREPGTMRSLVWVLVGLMGSQATDSDVAQWAAIGTMVLGLVSALMPEKKVDTAAVAEAVAPAAADAVVDKLASVAPVGSGLRQATTAAAEVGHNVTVAAGTRASGRLMGDS
ncbi:hypothetical protein [Roseomonas sp. BN140053]|uniref:hypothetical protein n=1 Tax=Roseomonas sp. BN140053 TaxID=3391898 RepID=UPI0039EB6EB7